jgi:hypothetical protein
LARARPIDTLAAVLHVDGVDDRTSRDRLERALDHRGFRRVDHDRRVDGHRKQLDDLRHLLGFVAALGHRDTDVEQMRARLDLLTRDIRDPLVVFREQQPLHLARTLRVHALANEQRLRILIEVRGAHCGGGARDFGAARRREEMGSG